MLFEAVLISRPRCRPRSPACGTARTDWTGADVTKAINDYKKLLTYTNTDRDTLDWTDAEKLRHGRQGRLPADG